jgi:hypothetical protein
MIGMALSSGILCLGIVNAFCLKARHFIRRETKRPNYPKELFLSFGSSAIFVLFFVE